MTRPRGYSPPVEYDLFYPGKWGKPLEVLNQLAAKGWRVRAASHNGDGALVLVLEREG